jgi:thiol-disulfide isomerase/thioredoxin
MRPLRTIAVAVTALLAACAAEPTTSPADPTSPPSPAAPSTEAPTASAAPSASEPAAAVDPLLDFELLDVRTGETFTLAELAADKPVLVESMAIWCTTCLSQQREVVRAHELGDFHSVGIDVDPNERAPDLAEYAEREGFDWHFAIADREIVRLLTERFGFEVSYPPSVPTFVVSSPQAIRALDFGRIRSAEELVDELGAG